MSSSVCSGARNEVEQEPVLEPHWKWELVPVSLLGGAGPRPQASVHRSLHSPLIHLYICLQRKHTSLCLKDIN